MPEEKRKRATALRYTEGSDAPEVVATGRGEIARRILDAAEEAGVPVRRDPGLVEALGKLDVGQVDSSGPVRGGRRGARVGLQARRAGVAAAARGGISDLAEERLVLGEGGAQRALELGVDLADAALGDAEDLADLAEGELLDVEQDRDLALTAGEAAEGVAEAVLRVAQRGDVLRVRRDVVGGQGVDALDARVLLAGHDRVERREVRRGDLLLAVAQLARRGAERGGQLLARGRAAVDAGEVAAGGLDVALPAADGARRPVLPAQLVEDRAVDAGPRELFERGALLGVVAVDRVDEGLEAAGDEVLHLAARRQLAHLAVGDVLHERGVGHDQPVAQRAVLRAAVLVPELLRVFRRDPAAARGLGLHLSWGLRDSRGGRGQLHAVSAASPRPLRSTCPWTPPHFWGPPPLRPTEHRPQVPHGAADDGEEPQRSLPVSLERFPAPHGPSRHPSHRRARRSSRRRGRRARA